MTLNFYQVNFELSSFNIPYFTTSSDNQTDNQNLLLILSQSRFILSPYLAPYYPYVSLPESYPKEARHIRQQSSYDSISNLDTKATADFIRSYQTFKYPICGDKNPTDITNPYYRWVIKHRLSVWDIQKLIIDCDNQANERSLLPLWCFDRMGQSKTVLSDGRMVFIGGEYEDYYDPDFCIYNDVTVIHPDGAIQLYSYPKSVFPPTDFHTATLVGNDIYIIGSLGYIDGRQYSHTPVYKLNTQTFKITQMATRNSMGWVRGHTAKLKDNRIFVSGGEVLINDVTPLLDNIDTWVLNLNTLIWKNITHNDKKWQRFYVTRQDGGCLHLWECQQLNESLEKSDEAKIAEYTQLIRENTNQTPNTAIISNYRQLLIPPIRHEVYSLDGTLKNNPLNYDYALVIDGIKVGYKTSDDCCIQVTIEGKLPEGTVELLQQNLRHKLCKIENMACEVIEF